METKPFEVAIGAVIVISLWLAFLWLLWAGVTFLFPKETMGYWEFVGWATLIQFAWAVTDVFIDKVNDRK